MGPDSARSAAAGNMPTYTCLCCGHSESFESAEAAHHASWDVAPYFTLQPLCDLCLSAPILILGLEGARQQHAAAHEQWKRNGRPRLVDNEAATDSGQDDA